MADVRWQNIPTVILLEIFSYLSKKDLLRASSTCRHWRQIAFHPKLWPSCAVFLGSEKDIPRALFQSYRCVKYSKNVCVSFSCKTAKLQQALIGILTELESNVFLQKFCLHPLDLSWIEFDQQDIEKCLDLFYAIINRSRRLEHWSLGSVEYFLEQVDSIIDALSERHAHRIRSLHLATIKRNPASYEFLEFSSNALTAFSSLNNLSLDYDHLSDGLLLSLMDKPIASMTVHVHAIDPRHPHTTETTWKSLVDRHPGLKLAITVLESPDAASHLISIFRASMPVNVLRLLFSTCVNESLINYVTVHYSSSLEVIHIVDLPSEGFPLMYNTFPDQIDPLVILAWKCSHLKELILIGYCIQDESIVAIARLRGSRLENLLIPASCIFTCTESDDYSYIEFASVDEFFFEKVSTSLSRPWRPHELAIDLWNESCTAAFRSYILPILFNEQHY